MKLSRIKLGIILSLVLIPLTGSSVFAQWSRYPSNGISRFRWQGVVDGTSYIYIRGRQVQTQSQSGLPVQRQQFAFTDPLPSAPVQLEVVELRGRGRLRLVQAPRSYNDFTAVVRIDDNSGGRDLYSFELRWYDLNARDDYGRSSRNLDGVVWRGRVDGESIIRFRGNQVWEERVSGRGVSDVRYRFSSPLPFQFINVNLIDTDGRGEILLIEQPSRFNNYTASVRIRDERGGAANYAFTLTWNR